MKKTDQQNEDGRIGGEQAVITGNPVEGDGAAIFSPKTLPPESHIGKRAEESGEYGLHVSVPCNHRVGIVRKGEGFESGEEGIASSAYDIDGRVGLGHSGHWGGGGCCWGAFGWWWVGSRGIHEGLPNVTEGGERRCRANGGSRHWSSTLLCYVEWLRRKV